MPFPSDSDFLLDATASKLRLPHFGHLIFFPMTSPPAWHPRCGCYSRPYLSPLIFEWDIFEPKELRPVFCYLWGQGLSSAQSCAQLYAYVWLIKAVVVQQKVVHAHCQDAVFIVGRPYDIANEDYLLKAVGNLHQGGLFLALFLLIG